MHFRKLLLAVSAAVVVTFSIGLRGQGLIDGIKVTLPEPVTVGDKVLEPGEYEIRRPSSANRQILQIFNNDKMVYETVVQTIPTGPDEKDPKETKVLLHHIGNAYYFDKIWMEEKNYGWEFPLPERVRALQRELAVSVPARYESVETSDEVSPDPGPGLAAELDAVAAQQANQQAAQADTEKGEHERLEQLERDRKAELDRQAELDRERQEPDRVAALQPEPSPAAPTQSEARSTQGQSDTQTDSQIPEQLPETATNWVALIISGLLLVCLSYFARRTRAQD